jgi:hypothetical protein
MVGMRRALVVLALLACGGEQARDGTRDSSAPGATVVAPDTGDGCHLTRGTRPDTGIHPGDAAAERWRRSYARGTEYYCRIHATMPATRFIVAGDSAIPQLDSVLVFADSLSLRPMQTMPFDAEMEMPSPWNGSVLHAVDLDNDGYRDLLVGKFWGATGNTFYYVWRFNPASRRFVIDSALTDVSNPRSVPGRACVRTHSNTSARDDASSLLCLRTGRWIMDSAEVNTWDRKANVVMHEVHARQGDSLVVVRRETRADSMR